VSAPVIVGYDGSAASQAALERGIAEARSSGGQLVVLAVYELPVDPEGQMEFGTLDDGRVETLPLEPPPEIERVLDGARERIEPHGLDAEYAWDAGEPASAIVGEAKARNAGLVVLGKTHHSRLARWLGTDVAAEVERAAGCPVLRVEA
jgi:nucleotide-binding universal stress UspA family protein